MGNLEIFQSLEGKEIINSPSKFMNWLKPTLIKAERDSIFCSYIVREEMTNPYQILHGGVTAGIIDDLIGATVFLLDLPNPYTTINNSIDYFSPAKMGDEITAKTSIIKQGKLVINIQCEVFLSSKNRLIARGTSNMFAVK